jgi:uncharacterized protein
MSEMPQDPNLDDPSRNFAAWPENDPERALAESDASQAQTAQESDPPHFPSAWQEPVRSEFSIFNPAPAPPAPPERIPNLGHVMLLIPLLGVGFVAGLILFMAAAHFHVFGVSSIQQAGTEIHYILGFEAVLYLFTFAAAALVFPMFWHESLFAGLQWNGAKAVRLIGRLVSAAFVCFLLAWVSGLFMPSPTNTPIEKIFRTPGAAWFLFAFGISFAPFFEEMFFRGFLLPSLCTAYDWISERITRQPARPLGEHGHPQWSRAAMIVGAIATSIPFAAMHAEQTGYSIGPFLLLVCVSLVLCGVRLATRSLAASTIVHSCYNLMLFSLMLIGTDGFKHLDKM